MSTDKPETLRCSHHCINVVHTNYSLAVAVVRLVIFFETQMFLLRFLRGGLVMVERYAHLAPDLLAKAANRLDAILSGYDLVTLEKEKGAREQR
jgi:hypothetical protein